VSCVGVNIRAVLLNVLHPINRGTAFSLFMLTDDLGKGLGPLVVAGFIAAFGREFAFLLSVLFWIPCGLLIAASAYTVNQDIQTVAARYQNDLAEENRAIRVD
jgi:MFS-type transporter involved in bile tolerance (Atg22 family)